MEHDGKNEARSEPQNIVICCDGTGNEISENISNVLKLYRCLRKADRTRPWQLMFNDPGLSHDGSDGVVEAPISDRFAKAASRPYGRVGRARQHVGGRGWTGISGLQPKKTRMSRSASAARALTVH